MAWQAYAAAAGMAMLQKMMASKAAIGKEFAQGWEEAETGGMGMGESIRPGISQDKSVLPGLAKSMVSTYMKGVETTENQPLVSETLGQIGSSAVQGMGELGNQVTQQNFMSNIVNSFDWMDHAMIGKLMEYLQSFQKGKK